jgi:hypothetical protein
MSQLRKFAFVCPCGENTRTKSIHFTYACNSERSHLRYSRPCNVTDSVEPVCFLGPTSS